MGNKKHRILFKKEKNGTRINADGVFRRSV
jgi:hypothetical protein